MKEDIVHYEAKAAPGIIFPAKTFILEDNKKIYIISPCELESERKEYLKKSKKELNFIAPNNFHNLYLNSMSKSFPDANFYGPKRSALKAALTLKDTSEIQSNQMKTIYIQGCKLISETCFYVPSSKTLYVTDLIFNMNHQMSFPMKLMMKLVGAYHKVATSKMEIKAIKDKAAFISSIKELLSLEIDQVIPSHGDPITRSDFEKWGNDLINRLS